MTVQKSCYTIQTRRASTEIGKEESLVLQFQRSDPKGGKKTVSECNIYKVLFNTPTPSKVRELHIWVYTGAYYAQSFLWMREKMETVHSKHN